MSSQNTAPCFLTSVAVINHYLFLNLNFRFRIYNYMQRRLDKFMSDVLLYGDFHTFL